METPVTLPTPAASLPDLDRSFLADVYGGDAAYASELFSVFLTAVLPPIRNLGALVARQDGPEVSRLAHKFRPTLRMVGLTALEDRLRVIQQVAETDPASPELGARWQAFAAELEAWVPVVETELARLQHQVLTGPAPL
jgi:HPt (histidine-containing phosphotransfer) domain-containing protein